MTDLNIRINMPTNEGFECSDSAEDDPLLRIIGKYQHHPSIKLLKAKINPKHSNSETLILMR